VQCRSPWYSPVILTMPDFHQLRPRVNAKANGPRSHQPRRSDGHPKPFVTQWVTNGLVSRRGAKPRGKGKFHREAWSSSPTIDLCVLRARARNYLTTRHRGGACRRPPEAGKPAGVRKERPCTRTGNCLHGTAGVTRNQSKSAWPVFSAVGAALAKRPTLAPIQRSPEALNGSPMGMNARLSKL
jgi:hypothetical protein